MSFNFVNISRQRITEANKKPGHSDVAYIAPVGFLDTIAGALDDGTPGSTKRITASHTFLPNKGFIQVIAKPKSIDPTGDAQGEAGGQVASYKYKVIIKGDSDVIQEFVEQILNEDVILLVNSPVCGQNAFIQIGSECSAAQISGFSFRGGSRGNGGFPEYEFTVESSDRFFYEGTVTQLTDSDLLLDAPSAPIVSGISATAATVTWGDVPNATSYEIERSTSPAFTSPTAETIADPTVAKSYTGLVTATTYYFRVRAVATGYVTSGWSTAAFTTS